MPGKYEGNTDESLAEKLHAATMDGTCETSGTVEAPCGWFGLVEDYDDMDWIVREDDRGFISIEGPFEPIAIGEGAPYEMRGGATSVTTYVQPARVRFEELDAEYGLWADDDEMEDA